MTLLNDNMALESKVPQFTPSNCSIFHIPVFSRLCDISNQRQQQMKKTSSFFCILKKYGKRQILFFYIFFPSFIKTVIHHGLYFSFQLYFLYFSGLNPSISFCLSDFLSAFVLKTLFILSLRTNIKRLFAFAYQQYILRIRQLT